MTTLFTDETYEAVRGMVLVVVGMCDSKGLLVRKVGGRDFRR